MRTRGRGLGVLVLCLALSVGGLLTGLGRSSPAQGATDTDVLTTIRRGVEHREQCVTSAVGEFVVEVQSPTEDAGQHEPAHPTHALVMWAFDAHKYREDIVQTTDLMALGSSVPAPHTASRAWDGVNAYKYHTSRPLVVDTTTDSVLGSTFVEFWLRLRTPCTNSRPLSEWLSTEGVKLVREEEVGGVSCWLLELQLVQPGPYDMWYRWWIAPEKDYMVLKYESELWNRDNNPRRTRVTRETADVLARYGPADGIWFAKERTSTATLRPAPDAPEEKLLERMRFVILSLAINTPLPNDLFQLEAPDDAEERATAE